MRKSRQISLKECYEALQLPKNASLEDVKKSYRRRAFELHPDLNPDNPSASKQFQLLNEAYVALSQILQTDEGARKESAKEENKKSTTHTTYSRPKPQYDAAQKAREEAQQEEARKRQEQAFKRQEEARQERLRREKIRQDKEREEKLRRERLHQEKIRQEKLRQEMLRQKAATQAAKEKAAQEKAAQEKAAREEAARQKAAQEQAARAQAQTAQNAQPTAQEQAEIRQKAEESRQRVANEAYEKEDVLRDLLDDPFARRVFEDIYSEVHKQNSEKSTQGTANTAKNAQDTTANPTANPAASAEQKAPSAPQAASQPPPVVEVDLGDNKASLHMANSFSDKIKGWFKQQIDDEQTIRMPASTLFVGSRIRLQIRRGLSEDLSTVEIVLPPDFVVGKPIRLRGLGKRVGKWQGDLYLTIESK